MKKQLVEWGFFYSFRVQYVKWKEECSEVFPVVGSGKFITAPVITEEGQPIQDPIVLQQTNSGKKLAYLSKRMSNDL